jgi:hypothetical protein
MMVNPGFEACRRLGLFLRSALGSLLDAIDLMAADVFGDV